MKKKHSNLILKSYFLCFVLILIRTLAAYSQCQIDSLLLINYPNQLGLSNIEKYNKKFCFDKKENAILLKNIVLNRLEQHKAVNFELLKFTITCFAYTSLKQIEDKLTFQEGISLIEKVIKLDTTFNKIEQLDLLKLKYHFFEQSPSYITNPTVKRLYDNEKARFLSEINGKQTEIVLDETYQLYNYFYEYSDLIWRLNPEKNKEEALTYLHNIEKYNFIWIRNQSTLQKYYDLYGKMAMLKLLILRGDLRGLEISRFRFFVPESVNKIHEMYIKELGGEYPPILWNNY